MTTENLEHLFETQQESPQLDFKGPMAWDVKSFAKDFLAMANERDGGTLVVGVEEDKALIPPYVRRGVSDTDLATFDFDHMKDELARYADPHVDFTVFHVADKDELKFVVIKIHEFDAIPVICKKDCKEVYDGRIYGRKRDKRPQSAPIASSHQMREIIDRATVKMMQHYQRLGLGVSTQIPDVQKFDAESKNF